MNIQEYDKERLIYARISLFAKLLGYSALSSFILIMIFMKDIHIKYSILTYYSILCRVGGIMIFKYYEVPNLVHDFANGNDDLYPVIHENKDRILKDLFKSLYGLGFDRTLLEISPEDLKKHIKELERRDWKKYGKIYLGFFILMTCITIWVLLL